MHPLPDEAQLIARARQKDRDAVSALYEGYVQAIFRYVSYRVPSDQVAEDLTSEVFLRMVQGLPAYQDTGAPFGAWLYRIAASQVADYYRRGRRESPDPLPETVVSDDTDPLGKTARAEEQARLRQALATLSEEHQTLLIMRFMQQMTHGDVAVVLGKSEAAIRVMQHRALSALAKALGQSGKARSYLRGKDHG